MLKNLREKLLRSGWLDKLEKLFFSLFLLSIPLQTRLTFSTAETYVHGTFNEYATFFIYLSDIFLLITLFIYFVNLLVMSPPHFSTKILISNVKKYFLSDQRDKDSPYKDNLTKRGIISLIINKLSTSPQLIPIILLSMLILWSFLSLIWAQYQDVALFRSLKFLELSLFFIYLNKRFYWFGQTRLFALVFIFGVAQSIIGILQYLYQHSLGLKLLGESMISPNIDNVAKIIFEGIKIIRAYGTFPHPNIFAAFLILSIFSGFWLLLSFFKKIGIVEIASPPVAPKQIVSRETILAGPFENKLYLSRSFESETHYINFKSILFKLFQVKQFDIYIDILWLGLLTIGIILQFYALLLTFSRLAWGGLILVLVLIIFLNLNKLFHVKQFITKDVNKLQKVSLLVIVLGIAVLFGLYRNMIINRVVDLDQAYGQSIDNRILYKDIALNIIKNNQLLGVGSGNFTLVMAKYTERSLDWWQYQPVHNIYLLIGSELGMVGLIIFTFFLLFLSCNACFKQKKQVISVLPFIAPVFLGANYYKKNNQIISPSATLLKNVSRETFSLEAPKIQSIWLNNLTLSIFAAFLFMGLYDHYFWSFQQGQLIFWLVLGVLFALNNKKH